MKKIFTLLTIACGLSFGANAQRMVDLEVTLNSPAVSSTIDSGVTFQVSAVVKNVGANQLKAGDTIVYQMLLGNAVITIGGGSLFYIPNKNGVVMNTNDTFQINRSITLNYTTPTSTDQTLDFCVVAIPLQRTADSVRDNVTTNNAGCNQITLKAHFDPTTSVNQYTLVTDKSTVNAYPNPASSNINLDINMNGNHNVMVNVTDITGRVVFTKDLGKLTAGNHKIPVNTESLNNGIYLYQVSFDGQVQSGKFSVVK